MLAIYRASKEFTWKLGDWRRKVALFILVTQAIIPLRYYVLNPDPLDERFAWRMLSDTSMADKRIGVVLIGWDTSRVRLRIDQKLSNTENMLIEFGHDATLDKLCHYLMDWKPWVRGVEVHSMHRFLDNSVVTKKFVCMQ